ncbi:MAG: 2-oxo acid dehydrogenase subunit E2 [bacterium]|nr:2-oxo acid dehydrogenase subunit E2 [bacterium]
MSPRARRFAEERRLSPENVAGSGTGGRVLEADLRALYEAAPRTSSTAREMMRSGYRARGDGSGPNRMVRASDLMEPPERMSRMRATIARRMRESLSETAQYTLHSSADATGLLAVRKRLKAEGSDVNINDLIMYCAVQTLGEAPEINAELIDGEIYRHSGIHLGFACDTPRGLVVPVVKNCQSLNLEELAAWVHQLSEQAANGTLGPDEMTGGTFTVSNLGTLGIEAFTPIVNPPQVAVLGVNAIQLKPVRQGDEVALVDHVGFSLTCDHQVIDGAPGARFLEKLTQKV